MRQRISFCKTSDGVRIAYAVAGSGPPLIRVGGWLTHVEHDWGSPVWLHWLRELTHGHTLARFDIRGSGLSDRVVSEQGLEAWVRDLEAVADSLASQLPDAHFLPLRGENHILQLEDSSWPIFIGELRRFLADVPAAQGGRAAPWISELTSRQRVVLNLVARGQSNTEIAQALFIATKTVRNHVCAICGNLDIPTRAQLIVQAREKGFGAD